MPRKYRGLSPSFCLPKKFLALLLIACSVIAVSASAAIAKERRAEVTYSVDLKAPADAKHVRIWLPYPMSDENQEITDVVVTGNPTAWGIYKEGAFGNAALYAEWKDTKGPRTLTYTFEVLRRERVTRDIPTSELPFSKTEFRKELAATRLADLKGREKALAEKITAGKKTNREKAFAIYNWTVENMFRDPNTKGCGLGEVDTLVRTLGGKCGDIHSVYTALARASGLPARELFGIRIPAGKEGDMTKAQHCWEEWYSPGYGWVVVDPADVRKAILEKKITLEQAKPLREYYFGAVDESRIAIGTGRDLVLNPPQAGEPLNYFMYPYAEADGKPLNEDLYGFNIGYKITFREI
ncbi:transglutaminase-like domain-containing protein [Candidatus Deferrimicrobium sp.]|uniref:transglutaminase-like domain-containing protein n=1 Tax=Candidatus Deferrimicrobium sp. TaxID=3060586 RepID=UPI003C5923BF